MAYLSTTLRPNAGRAFLLSRFGAATAYDCVNEVSSDGDTTYLYFRANIAGVPESGEDTLDIPDLTNAGGVNKVTVYVVCRKGTAVTVGNAKTQVIVGGNTFYGSTEALTTSYVAYSTEYTVSPDTSSVWTVDEVNGMEIGVWLETDSTDTSGGVRCTQIYAVVEYTPLIHKLVVDGQKLSVASGSTVGIESY